MPIKPARERLRAHGMSINSAPSRQSALQLPARSIVLRSFRVPKFRRCFNKGDASYGGLRLAQKCRGRSGGIAELHTDEERRYELRRVCKRDKPLQGSRYCFPSRWSDGSHSCSRYAKADSTTHKGKRQSASGQDTKCTTSWK